MAYMLLTGATGLLGGYLLRDALRHDLPVAVIVRRSAVLSAQRRIDAVLAPFESERALPRPVVLEGDLSQPGLGLSDDDRQWLTNHCTSVLHSAASISFYRDEKDGEPYRTNVDGTRHLLDMCRDAGIEEFHHVSTAYVCGRRSGRVLESELEVGQEYGNDYELSKVASEKLVHSAGFEERPTIYRPSIIVGDSQTGYTTTFHGYYTPLQVAWWLAKAGLLQSGVHDWFLAQLGLQGDERKNIVPVDWVSRVIMHLVEDPSAHGRTYHVTCDDPPTSSDLALGISDALGRHIAAATPGPANGAAGEMLEAADFRKHMDVYRAYFRDHPEFDTTNLRQAAPNLTCPRVDRELLARTGQYALDSNFGWPRKQPPAPPIDIDRSIGFQPGRARASTAATVLEITGVGGGAYSIDPDSGHIAERGRPDNPAATIRLRSDTLAELASGRLPLAAALLAGRVSVAGSPEHVDCAEELLKRLVAQLKSPAKVNGSHRPEPVRSLLKTHVERAT